MRRWYSMWLLLGSILFAAVLIFLWPNSDITQRQLSLSQLQALHQEVDDLLLAGELEREDFTRDTTDEDLFSEVADVLSDSGEVERDELVDELIGDTTSRDMYLQSHQRVVRLELLDHMYRSQWLVDLLPTLIEYALLTHRYAQALQYVLEAQRHGAVFSRIPTSRLLYVLVSAGSFGDTHRHQIKSLVDNLFLEGRIDQATVDFHYALLAFVQFDLDNYSYFMDQLVDTSYDSWYYAFQDQRAQLDLYQDVSDVYLYGLIALRYFREWYPAVARTAAEFMLTREPHYLLAHQLLAYTNLLLGSWEAARDAFVTLEQLDSPHLSRYAYFQWVTYFEMSDYTNAILQFARVREVDLDVDVARYLFLSYALVDDQTHTDRMRLRIMQMPPHLLTAFDFFTVFDVTFYGRDYTAVHDDELVASWTGVERGVNGLSVEQLRALEGFIDRCYQTLPDELVYVCLYGKAGYTLLMGDTAQSYVYISQLVNRYPTSQLFLRAAQLADELGYLDDAKRLIARSILASQDEDEQVFLRNYLMNLYR